MLHAYLNRAWPGNDEVLRELLEIRRERARLLGYDGWPSYDAEVKMIPTSGSGAAIPEFVDRITALAQDRAERDIATLLARVRQDRPEATLVDGVDKMFYAEAVRREHFDVDAQQVRRYFDFANVRQACSTSPVVSSG